jgi:hypothetical protein
MNNTATTKIKKQDWIIARLLFLLSVNDPTVWKFRDVRETQKYLEKRYGADFDLLSCFQLLVKEHAQLGTFYNKPDIKICRELDKAVEYGDKDDGTDYVQWRFNNE